MFFFASLQREGKRKLTLHSFHLLLWGLDLQSGDVQVTLNKSPAPALDHHLQATVNMPNKVNVSVRFSVSLPSICEPCGQWDKSINTTL
jgi:hypothetical protein